MALLVALLVGQAAMRHRATHPQRGSRSPRQAFQSHTHTVGLAGGLRKGEIKNNSRTAFCVETTVHGASRGGKRQGEVAEEAGRIEKGKGGRQVGSG